jgi:hypothetical protein
MNPRIGSLAASASAVAVAVVLGGGCSSNGNSGGAATQTGSACTTAATCYAPLDAAALHGQVTCLTQVTNGYCTHTCQTDADCCAVPGECAGGIQQVCAPFESTPQTYCFVSCDASAIPGDAGTTDPNTFCQRFNASFTCRSTGGGSANRKFCGG